MKFNPRRLAWVAKRSFPLTIAVSAALIAGSAWVNVWADTPAKKKGDAGAVTVDFSVLGDATPGLLGAPLPGSGGRRLLMPGVKSPRSQLHVSPVQTSRRAPPPRKARAAPSLSKAAPSAKVAAAPAPPAMPVPKVEATPLAMPAPKVEATPPPPPPKADKPPASLAIVPELEGVATTAIETPEPESAKTEPEKSQPEKTMAAEPPAPPPALTPPESPKEPPKEPETAATTPPEKVAEKAPEPAPPPPPTPTPEPAAGTEKPAEPAPTEKAALTPPAMTLEPGRAMRVAFDAAQSKVPVDVKPLLEELAAKLKDQPGLRVQILAYAGGGDLSAGKARRLSLSRALSVRSFLIGKEIRSTRIDVRALGNKTTEKPLNRVDINITER